MSIGNEQKIAFRHDMAYRLIEAGLTDGIDIKDSIEVLENFIYMQPVESATPEPEQENPVSPAMKLETIVLVAGRSAPNGLELYLPGVAPNIRDEFATPVYVYTELIGYLIFKRITLDTFQLVKLHSADSQSPYPIVPLTGVLYSRQAALEAHQSLSSYLQGLS